MKHSHTLILVTAGLFAGWPAPAGAIVPEQINYQGRITVNSENYNGPGLFKFAIVGIEGADTVSHWSNDGQSVGGGEPVAHVMIEVKHGLFALALGDSSLMDPLPPEIFQHENLLLRIWFNDGVHGFQQLDPDHRFTSVAYAMLAATVVDDAITENKLAADAVTTPKIALEAVTTPKLADEAVTTPKIADQAVTESKLAANSVQTQHLADQAVTASKVALNAVSSTKLASNSVSTTKIANLAVTNDKLALNAVTTDKIVNFNVTDLKLANNSVTTLKIANLQVDEAALGGGAVTHDKLADNSIAEAHIQENAVTHEKLADSSIFTRHLTGNSVTNFALAANSVTTDKLGPGSVTGTKIAEGAVTNEHLVADAGIPDTKLATITTPGKVANSATTATAENLPGTIVLRDGDGNFSAGTITADLLGYASLNVAKEGDEMTGTLTAPQFISNAPEGVPPLEVTSTTMVENLNVEYLGGFRFDDFVTTSDSSYGGTASFEGELTVQGLLTAERVPTGAGVADGAVLINPPSAGTGQTLLGVAVGSEEKLRLDSDGNLSISGKLGIGVESPSEALEVEGVIHIGNGAMIVHGEEFVVRVNDTPAVRINANGIILGHEENTIGEGLTGSVIGGGGASLSPNEATGSFATVGGGIGNTAGDGATVGGGMYNTASGYNSTIGGGRANDASGDYSTIPGGFGNLAEGDFSFAAGSLAYARHEGSFVWCDGTTELESPGQQSFTALASGGFTFYTTQGETSGVHLAPGSGTWQSVSDRNAKENFQAVDEADVLERLAGIPITTWNYKTQDPSIRHMGVMAQDFHAAFGLGYGDTTITDLDAHGVSMVAIQGLYKKLEMRNAELEDKLRRREEKLVELGEKVAALSLIAGLETNQSRGAGPAAPNTEE